MKIPAWLTVQLASLTAVAALVFLLVGQCNRAGRAEAAARAAESRAEEAAQAAAAGVPLVEPVDVAFLERQVAAALRENDVLRRALDRAQDAIPGARVVGLARAAVEGAAHGTPRPVQDVPPATSPAGTAGPPAVETPSSAVGVACLLGEGDGLRLELEAPLLKGKSGAHYLVGTMSARRQADGELLLREPLTAALTEAVEAGPGTVRRPGWAWGAGAGISGRGTLGGVLLQTPPARLPLLHWPARAWVLGAGGASQGMLLGGVSVEP